MKNKVVVLEDKKEYVVVSSIELDGVNYLYMISNSDSNEHRIGICKDIEDYKDISYLEDNDSSKELETKLIEEFKKELNQG